MDRVFSRTRASRASPYPRFQKQVQVKKKIFGMYWFDHLIPTSILKRDTCIFRRTHRHSETTSVKRNWKLVYKCGFTFCGPTSEQAKKKPLDLSNLGSKTSLARIRAKCLSCSNESLEHLKPHVYINFQLCFTNAVSDLLHHPHMANGSTIALTQGRWGDFVSIMYRICVAVDLRMVRFACATID